MTMQAQSLTTERRRPWQAGRITAVLLAICLAAFLAESARATGQRPVDQSQRHLLGTLPSQRLVQSFSQQRSTISGVSVFMGNTLQPVTVSLWGQHPDDGGHPIRSVSTDAAHVPAWVSVSWPSVRIDESRQYFLEVSAGGVFWVGVDEGNPYPNGELIFPPDYPKFDLAFETFGDIGGDDCVVDVAQRASLPGNSESGGFALGLDLETAQSFKATTDSISGAQVAMWRGDVADVELSLWTDLPSSGGTKLASGVAIDVDCDARQWATVKWAPVPVTPGNTYYLVANAEENPTGAPAANFSDFTDVYPDGTVWVDGGDLGFFVGDLTFEIFSCTGGGCRVDVAQVLEDAAFPFGSVAQSFRPDHANLSGVGLLVASGFPADLTIELWDGLPGTGGQRLAIGTEVAFESSSPTWIHVEWSPVAVSPGETYFIVIPYPGFDLVSGPPFDPYAEGELVAWPSGDEIAGTLDLAFRTYSCIVDCYTGNVNQTGESVLYMNGLSPGGSFLEVPAGTGFTGSIFKPSAGGNGKYVIHANWGAPTQETSVSLPANIGTACFDFLIASGGGTGTPVAIWNNIGKTDKVGASTYFDGAPMADPPRAFANFLTLPTGDTNHLPVGTLVTFEGVIIDPAAASPKSVSKTNAVTVSFQ